MAQAKRGTANRFRNATTFFEQLKLALEFHNAPAILRAHSPLAAPYFLHQETAFAEPTGRDTDSDTDSDTEIDTDALEDSEPDWGETLSSCLDRALAGLWPGDLPKTKDDLLRGIEQDDAQDAGRCYHFLVLELNYFKHVYKPIPKNQSEIYNDILHIGRTTHDRHLREAVEQLGNVLLKQLRPIMRLELPSPPSVFLGRERILQDGLQRLERKESISLTGPAGMGKTTLATKIAESWQPSPLFWFTIRHDFNDRLSSLLFALGYFLHRSGSSGLWLQLVANGGSIDDANLALALALADLESIPSLPLLCFDEIDLLLATDIDSTPAHHTQLLTFIESLRSHTPLLLIGQKAAVETSITLTLDQLAQADIGQWLTLHQIAHTPAELAQLEAYTRGNPRLLTLCLALHQSLGLEAAESSNTFADTSFANTLARLPSSPGLSPIWLRIRNRLSPHERGLLDAISVFRGSTPADAWDTFDKTADTDDPLDTPLDDPLDEPLDEPLDIERDMERIARETIQRLLARQLLQQNESGGLLLLPALGTIIYKEMAVERREMAHISAAHIHAARGEVTEAAYHFSQGGDPATAIRLWFPQMDQEIQRGQVATALPIFEEISAQRLKPAQQKQLAVIRGTLYQLGGDPERVVDGLAAVDWPNDDPLSVEAMFLWGKALDAQGDGYRAKEKLARGIDVAAHLLQKTSLLHVARGLIYMHEREISQATKDVTWAHFHAEMLDGAIQVERGELTRAQECLGNAVKLAQKLDDPSALGRAHYYLANAASRQQNFPLAFRHYELSIEQYHDSGNQVDEAQLRANLASNFLLTQEYDAAIQEATTALTFFKKIKSPYWSALCANTIAEAHVELGNLDNAEQYAMEVIGHEDSEFFPYGLFTIGSVRRANGQLKEAHSLYSQSCEIAQENEDLYLRAFAERALGEVEVELENKTAAHQHLSNAIDLFRQMEITAEVEKTEAVICRFV